jgi:hypothetical protein
MKAEQNLTEPTDTQDAFWLVWCPQGTTPKYRHSTRESAETEAERLAQQDQSRDFYVVKAQSLYKAEVLIKTTNFENDTVSKNSFKIGDIVYVTCIYTGDKIKAKIKEILKKKYCYIKVLTQNTHDKPYSSNQIYQFNLKKLIPFE